jgi:predicted unusual protein kinase regulating ubiquinone biosynthesis (AarF/ABC1/UbiB family)
MREQDKSQWSDVEAKEVETGRFKRAWKLGKLGAKMTGSFLKDRLKQSINSEETSEFGALQTAAIRNAQEMAMVMGQLKGAAMKLGQMLSSDPEMISPEFADALAVLQRQAPPMPYQQLKATLESELGGPMQETFSFFDPRPLGAASIGQVHRATLLNGEEVAVKIQYPGISDSLESDLSNIERFMVIGRPLLPKDRAQGFIAELKAAFEQEADYEGEAHKLEEFNKHFEDWPQIRVPKPYLKLCTPRLLIMEFIEGDVFHTAANQLEDQAQRDALMKTFVEAFVYMFHDLHRLHADPHPGNFMLDLEGRLVILDFGCVCSFEPELSDSVLSILPAFWSGDSQRQMDSLLNVGFGRKDAKLPKLESIARHQELILAPMAHRQPFSFYSWRVSEDLRELLTSDLTFVNLVPPAELLLYLRVISGIKGTLSQLNASCNIREIAERACVRRGLST